MPQTKPTRNTDRNPVERLAEEFVERRRRGEHPSITEYTSKYPDLADAICDLFPALLVMERLKPASDELSAANEAEPDRGTPRLGSPIECLGDYRILREVSRGGMGVVYEAVQESLGRHVALKILPINGRLSPTQLERFTLEARLAARLHHSNIVPVHGVGEHQGVHYYAMQFIHGLGLDAILDDLRELRGLGQRSAGSRADDGRSVVTDGHPSSIAVACSLLVGTFEKTRAGGLSVSAAALPAGAQMGPDDISRLGPIAAPRDAASSDPEGGCSSPDSGSTISSALSLETDLQFYRSVARIGLQVAEALAYAHQQGVLHRDIKPSNLLLDAAGNIWVTDFGLAKVEGSAGPTRTGDIVGTVRYMAPERFDGWSDRRSDVYSLGVTLYELLTLRSLFANAVHAELIEKVLHQPPDPPRKLDPKIPRDLETIVLKAIAKEPGDRYPTAQALSADLNRFLEDRPVLARRSALPEQFWRWCRRNSSLAAACIAAAVAILILAMGATVAAWTFRAQRDHIRQAETRGRERLFEALLERARAGRFSRRMGQRFKSLEALSQAADIGRELKLPLGRFEPLRDEAIACLALPDLKQTGRVIHRPPGVFLVAFDAAMTRYALRFLDEVQVRRVADDREIARFPARGFQGIYVLSFSPDGRYLATKHHPGYALTVWDVDQRAVVVDEPGPVSERAAGFSPDSRRIALAREGGEILVYDLATGQPIPLSNVPAARDLAFRPDGGQIAVISSRLNKSSCQILDSRSGQLVRSIPLKGIGEVSVAWSPDGATLAIPCEDLRIYQWDAATGARKATLEGHISKGLLAAFHPSGTLLASNGWEGRLWLWNPVFGRPWLNLANEAWPQFTQFSSDGRIVASLGDKLTTYQVDPALEYRTFARVSAQLNEFGRPSLHPDGRILAAGTSQGVVLWDLALGRELAFLPIENAWHLMFEPSGDLLTSGTLGVWRWPIRLDSGRLDVRVGPPRQLPLPDGAGGIAEDETGQVIAKANFGEAHVLTPSRAFLVGPHDDCRSVTISPDGQWLATGSHSSHGAQVWSMRDASSVAHLTVEGMCRVLFSPDGKRLMTMNPPCRLWNVGTWSEALRIGGTGLCFSPDARLLAVQDANRSIRLADPATGRTLARLEGPELCDVWGATFSRDGSRLVVSTNDGPAVHVWDLRTIRRRLAEMGLDWDAPPFAPPEDSTVDSKHPPAVNVHVDFGPLKRYRDVYWSHLEQHTIPAEELVTDCTYRLRALPGDPDLLHQRGHALLTLNRSEEALADFSAASAKRPRDMHLWAYRGVCHLALEQYEPALDHLEQALQTDPESVLAIADLGKLLNVRAWELVSGARSQSDSLLAARLAQISVALSPGQQTTLNTLGVAQYRASRFAEAIGTLEKSLVAGQGEFDGFDLFFLAMAHHRLGHPNQARACFERAIIWQNTHKIMPERQLREAAAFRAEAESVLGGPGGEPPVDVAPSPR